MSIPEVSIPPFAITYADVAYCKYVICAVKVPRNDSSTVHASHAQNQTSHQ